MEIKLFGRVKFNLDELTEKMNLLPEFRENVTAVNEVISNINSPMLIMVMGEFSTGKSTFINALVNKDIATVGARPTTAVITKLSYGAQDQIEVVFRDGIKKIVNPNEFSKLTAEVSENEYNDLHANIDYVSRTLPIDILKNMTIVDSPGLNSIKPVHAETTRKFMDKADSVIWLFSADTPAKQTEIDALKRLNPRLSPVVVLNKIDNVDEEEGESVESLIADIERKLRNNKIYAQKFIALSAKWAFEGALKRNSRLLTASNIGEFYNVVDTVIVPNRDKYKKDSLFDGTAYLVRGLSKKIARVRSKNSFLREENFSEYERTARNLKGLEDHLKSLFSVFADNAGKGTNAAEEFLLGTFYYTQLVPTGNAQSNYSEALAHFRRAAELGHHYAMATIGDMYNLGMGVKQDYSEALAWFQKAAECGNAEALSCIGTWYYEGRGVQQNYKKAAEFYTKAVELGDSMAAYNLAYLYSEGIGVGKNLSKARVLFEKAAEAGIPEAMIALVEMSKNKQEAAKWALKAAETGDADAMTGLGVCYYKGERGYKQNFREAFKWLKKAAEAGSVYSFYWLALMYYEGEGVKRNFYEAFKWFKKSAEDGDIASFYWLGTMYYKGDGVGQDYYEAFKWFKKSAEDEDTKSFYPLGLMYYEGKGVRQDYFEAFKWFKKSAEDGDTGSFYPLGLMYHEGEGVGQDYFEAFKWFKKSAEAGDTASFYRLGFMYQQGRGVGQDYSEAFKWFRKSADDDNNGYAMGFLARMYRYGNGVTPNYDTALIWYRRAINAGNDIARTEKVELEREIEAEKERERQRNNSSNREGNGNTAMWLGAGVGLAVGGPLGAVVGGWLGKKFFGK